MRQVPKKMQTIISFWRKFSLCGPLGYFLLMLGLLVVVYFPALDGGFVFDDEVFLRDNPMLRDPHALWHIWCDLGISDYWPIFYTAALAELRMFGDFMVGYHLVNLALHALNATLVALIARRLRLFAPFFLGALFALHPVAVESVAWIMQIKTLLATSFFLSSLIFFLDFDRHGAGKRYAAAWLFFLASLLTKTHMVLHPFLALVLIAWQKGWRLTRGNLWAALGLLPPAVLLGLLAVRQQALHDSFADTPPLGPPLLRLLHGAGAFWFYVEKALFPHNLMVVYPYWRWDAADVRSYLPLCGLLALVLLALLLRGGMLAALLCVGMALAPVLGIVSIAFMRYSLVADHWQYVALSGILAASVMPCGRFLWVRARSLAILAATLLLCAAATLSYQHAGIFQDNEALWLDTIAKNSEAWLAHYNLGSLMLREGRLDEGIVHLAAAVRLKPDYAHALTNLGTALRRKGDAAGALARYQEALHYDPAIAQAYAGIGGILLHEGQSVEAFRYLDRAVALDPQGTAGRYDLASQMLAQGNYRDARDAFTAILARDPVNAAADTGLGAALVMLGDEAGAERAWREALRLNPRMGEARENLTLLLSHQGRAEEAARLSLDPSAHGG